MRVLLAIAALVVAGCAKSGSGEAEYQNIRDLLRTEEYSVALSKAGEARRRAEQNADTRAQWRFRLLEAQALLALRRAPQAEALLERDPPQGSGWREIRARAQLLRGFAAYLSGHYTEARQYVDGAATLAREAGLASLSVEAELRRGLLLVNESRFAEAGDLFRRAIGEAEALHETELEAIGTGNLGYTLLQASRYDEAIVWFEKARQLHERLGAPESLARDNGNLGWCYFRLGDFETARARFQTAESAFAKAGNLFEEQAWLGNAASVAMMVQDFAAAAATYQQALALARQIANQRFVSQWLNNLALAYIELGDLNQAERVNREAFALQTELRDARSAVYLLYNSGRIAEGRGRFEEAEGCYRKALREPANDPTVILDTHAGLAEIYSRTNRRQQAEHEFEQSLASVNRQSSTLLKDEYRLSYLDSLIRFYQKYVEFLMANHEPDRALEVAESSRAQVLAQRSRRVEAVRRHTASEYREVARRAKAAVLEYWLGEERSFLWVITPQRIHNYQLPPARSIRALTEAYGRIIMGQRNPLEAGETARKLRDMLLAPAETDLCENCRVIIVPDRDLYALNFESLPGGAQADKFWIEDAAVTIAPSLNYLAEAGHRSRSPQTGTLLIGDPADALPEYPKLEFATREIESIRSSMGGKDVKVLEGSAARPDSYSRAQPGNFQFIHFSAHATANLQSPLDSAVILSGPPDRCRLFARDVMAVPLTAELVTISACRSAGARTYAGEGLVGFAWAFLRAGARNVIAGLWDVNDRSTAQLMASLYAELARGSTPSDALRAAKLSLIQGGGSYAKPYYWAPFQVYTSAAE